MAMRFYPKNKRSNLPEHAGVRWQEVLDRYVVENESELPESIIFDSGDGLTQECTQENTTICMSKINDDMDVILTDDPRDGSKFSLFRDTTGEAFDDASSLLQQAGAAAVHFTLYPTQEIAEVWTNLRVGDLSRLDTIPEDWA